MGAVLDGADVEVESEESTGGLAGRSLGVWRRVVRPVFFWSHLAAGLAGGVVILIMSVTGVALTYQKQMTTWADLRGLNGAPQGSTTRLSADSILAIVARSQDAKPTNIIVRSGENTPVEVGLPESKRMFLNAYSGEVLGTGSTSMRKFFRVMTDWHRWIAMSGESRAKGRAITGASNLAFLLLVLSGIWLWIPNNWTRVAFRNVLQFRRGLRAKARDFNWHNVLGVWSFVPLVVVVASGAVISYPWASDLVYVAAGEKPPERPQPNAAPNAAANSREGATSRTDTVVVSSLSLQSALDEATKVSADWRTITLTVASRDDGGRAATIDRGMGGEPHKRAQFTVNADGSTKLAPFSEQTRARRWRSIMRFAHTGEVLGVVGQTIAGIVSFAAVVLVYTGFALSWRRWVGWRRRRIAR